ncbi:MAG: MurR/RpiR family transcriptional regulator [Erysipelotrichaceae bacterium]|nr:MurR/RpiR family transcriptional regulator [Erysipelotrichaceae bacterium]MDD3810618.1 MurR/RpiR family transcriptional regulator [Erysipelotrichaceae bacterium]
MNPLDKIEIQKDTFTKKELIIYDILKDNPDLILRGSLSSISKKYKVSQSTITRFCQKLGYDGFNEFKFDVFRFEKQGSESRIENDTLLSNYCQLIGILDDTLDYDKMNKLAGDIIRSDSVIVTGAHKSSLPAKMMQYNLFKIGKKAIFISNDEMQEMPHIATKDDLVLIFTNSGNGLEAFKATLKESKNKINFNLAVITMNNKLSIKNRCDNYIWVPSSSNQNFDQYLENQIMFFLYIDVLTSQISKLL